MILAWTGHRPDEIGGYEPNPTKDRVEEHIIDLLKFLKPEKCIVGMALGVDQMVAEACIKLGIPFIAAIPFKGQESVWPEAAQNKYRDLLSKAAEVVVVCEGPYAPWKMQKRNEWMVDHGDALGAVWNGSDGGTANCYKYAEKVEKTIYLIDPSKFE